MSENETTKYEDFLARIISEGIAAARESYKNSPLKLEGAIAGFEACLNKSIDELRDVLEQAKRNRNQALARNDGSYWKYRCFESEVEWVCNVVSAALLNEGSKDLIVEPTGRGLMQAARILGIESSKYN
jgi:hypothetical protein